MTLDPEFCWKAVLERDAAQDGHFVFGVTTTGVYCRPSCASRRALRRNIRFYEKPEQAERDGLRPCLRCCPLAAAGADPNTVRIRELCAFIEAHSDRTLTLQDLGARAGLSPFHLQRSFKAIAGVTPKQYQESCRLNAFKATLRQGREITAAIYDAGFGSGSRVYERADTRLGMTPGQYRSGGRDVRISYVSVASPLGRMTIGATDRGICFVQFGDSEADLLSALSKEYPRATVEPMQKPYPEDFARWMDALSRHLEGSHPALDLPLDVRATAFQLRVWNYLRSIPYGEVQSYREVAAGIGQPSAARAVARACAGNTVAVLIPCHRVIRGTGEPGGYRWGLPRKRILIDRERVAKAGGSDRDILNAR